MALHHLNLRQIYWSISHLDCPVEGCFKVFIHKCGVCSLLQQHLSMLRLVMESGPVERCHSLQNHSQKGERWAQAIRKEKGGPTFSPDPRAITRYIGCCLSVQSVLKPFNQQVLTEVLLCARKTGMENTTENYLNKTLALMGTAV